MTSQRNTSRFMVLLLISCLTLSAFSDPDTSFAQTDNRTVLVGIYENPPNVFTSESGKPAGIFIDIIEYIAKMEGWKLRFLSGTWVEGLDRLAKGQIDLMPDIAYTVDHEKIYTFHKVPALSSWFQVYAPKGSKIKTILDLDEKRILVLERSVQQKAFVQLGKGFGLNSTLITVPDYNTMFEMVANGEADAAITNRFNGMMQAKNFGLENTSVVFEPSDLFFAAPKKASGMFLNAIDRQLLNLKKDPQSVYYTSLKKWTSEDIQFELPGWVPVIGLISGVVLIMSLVGSIVLKHRVNARTRELKQINQEMEQRISERTEELAATMEKALAADRIKSAFLATMSHELRTPMNSIIGFTGIMLQGLAGPLNPEQNKQMTMVQNSARHLLALINDVLDISKIEAGQLEFSLTSFDLRLSIENVVKVISPLAQKKGIVLNLDISDNTGTITTDQRRLEQVMLNLLNNAVKFTEKGHVNILCRFKNGHYILSFADMGIGMRPEDLPNLFQPFTQVDTGLSRKHEGTGLGLSISKKILDMMGGSISVESQWGEGSIFTVCIPETTGDLP